MGHPPISRRSARGEGAEAKQAASIRGFALLARKMNSSGGGQERGVACRRRFTAPLGAVSVRRFSVPAGRTPSERRRGDAQFVSTTALAKGPMVGDTLPTPPARRDFGRPSRMTALKSTSGDTPLCSKLNLEKLL